MGLVKVISCVKGTGINACYWIVTYEVVGTFGQVGSKACITQYREGSVLSLSSLI